MKTVAIIEARMGSSRLPGKIMLPAAGQPCLAHLFERLGRAESVDEVVLATTVKPCDVVLADFAKREGVSHYRGSEDDVLGRVYEAAKVFGADTIVEVTSDCPLCDPGIVDRAVGVFRQGGYDYVSNVIKRTYPRGMDTQVFSFQALERAHLDSRDEADREHVSLYMYEHPEIFKLQNFTAERGGLNVESDERTGRGHMREERRSGKGRGKLRRNGRRRFAHH